MGSEAGHVEVRVCTECCWNESVAFPSTPNKGNSQLGTIVWNNTLFAREAYVPQQNCFGKRAWNMQQISAQNNPNSKANRCCSPARPRKTLDKLYLGRKSRQKYSPKPLIAKKSHYSTYFWASGGYEKFINVIPVSSSRKHQYSSHYVRRFTKGSPV